MNLGSRENFVNGLVWSGQKTLHAASQVGGAFVKVVSKTALFTSENLGINNENLSRLVRDIRDRSGRLNNVVQSNTLVLFRFSILDSAFTEIVSSRFNDPSFKLKIPKSIGLRPEPSWNNTLNTEERPFAKGIPKHLICETLWLVLKGNTLRKMPTEEDKKIKSWNTRIDENKLLKKLGSPKNWILDAEYQKNTEFSVQQEELFNDDTVCDNEDDCCEPEPVGILNFLSDRENPQSMEKPNQDNTDHDRYYQSAQKKKNAFFRPFSKLFKSGKHPKGKEVGIAKEKLNNNNYKQVRNNLDAERNASRGLVDDMRKTSAGRRTERRDNGDAMNGGDEAESLSIHIPGNISRIVLVKDGRKIALEI